RWAARKFTRVRFSSRGDLVEETEDRLLRLGRDRQRLNGELLPRLQGDEVRALLVHVGNRQLRRTAAEGRLVRRGEGDAGLQQAHVRAEALRIGLRQSDGAVEGVVSLVEDRHAKARRGGELEAA